LGVRRDSPVAEKTIVIEPHLGNLISAEGVVVTEFGPVPISWKRDETTLNFSFEVPPGVKATFRLPRDPGKQSVYLDSQTIHILPAAKRSSLIIGPGPHHGSF
jgi:hypothetical protein